MNELEKDILGNKGKKKRKEKERRFRSIDV